SPRPAPRSSTTGTAVTHAPPRRRSTPPRTRRCTAPCSSCSTKASPPTSAATRAAPTRCWPSARATRRWPWPRRRRSGRWTPGGPVLGPFKQFRDAETEALESMVLQHLSVDDVVAKLQKEADDAIGSYNDRVG